MRSRGPRDRASSPTKGRSPRLLGDKVIRGEEPSQNRPLGPMRHDELLCHVGTVPGTCEVRGGRAETAPSPALAIKPPGRLAQEGHEPFLGQRSTLGRGWAPWVALRQVRPRLAPWPREGAGTVPAARQRKSKDAHGSPLGAGCCAEKMTRCKQQSLQVRQMGRNAPKCACQPHLE